MSERELSTRRSNLSETKQALLEKLLRGRSARAGEAGAIPRRAEQDRAPLSFSQQRLWFLDQLEPGNPFYNMPSAMRLTGPLDVAAMAKSFAEISRRHESLRTKFISVEGRPAQVIGAEPLDLRVIDLSGVPQVRRDGLTLQLAKREARRPFDLTRGPVVRSILLRLSAEEHVLLLTMHHIVSDGWSVKVFIRELCALYKTFRAGQAPALPELPLQYADFAAWQREWVREGGLDRQLSYWKRQLEGAPPVLDLPADRPRPPAQSFKGASHSFTLPRALMSGLEKLSSEEGATLFMTMLAAFNTLIYRYTGQRDLLIGTPIANRNRAETEGLIGLFVNTLILRADMSGAPPFRELIRRTRKVALEAYANQDLPFEKLVEELQPERALSHMPLAQVMFSLQDDPREMIRLEGLTLSPLEVDSDTTRVDLWLSVEKTTRELPCTITYNTDLFDRSTVERISEHFRNLLDSLVGDPDQSISDASMLSAAERWRLLAEWNDTAVPYPENAGVHHLFEEQVGRTPDRVAIEYEGRQLTYEDLNRRANQLAHYLIENGVAEESRVAICVERGVDMLVALLGVLKAGAAYIPLDPAYPQERIAFIIEDARVELTLTQERIAGGLPGDAAKIIRVDSQWESVSACDAANPRTNVSPQNLAYAIYTSGSTGRPRGVQVTHAGVVNLLTGMKRRPGLAGHDILLAVTTLSFDIAALELLLPLIAGARVIVANREDASDARALAELVKNSGATLMQATPTTWRAMLDAGWEGGRNLKVLCGGEALSRQLADRLVGRAGEVWNMYGPTETTIWSATDPMAAGAEPVCIGGPIENTRLYVLDERLHPVPLGVVGELYIAGRGLARGYLHRPELTAERFVPDPHGAEAGGRLYATGDLVRYIGPSRLEYLGRKDQQVKVRGFRIELGEIEAALSRHPRVREAVVIVHEDAAENKLLAAFVVPRGEEPSGDDLRGYLKERLPEYMVPNVFATLDALPLTPNGKVDRRALVMPARPGTDPIAPRTPTEELLAGVWADVLGVARVGAGDNFFALGGHSLLATQVMSRVGDIFKVRMPLRRLFETPTLGRLAESIEAARGAESGSEPPPMLPVSRDGALPLSFAQQRLWFLDQLEPGSPFYNLPMPIRLIGKLDAAALEQSIGEIIRRHEVLRTSFPTIGGEPAQVISPYITFRLPVVDLSDLPESLREAEALRLATEDAQRPFDLARGPLLRASLLRLAREDQVVLFTLHHTVFDGWSMGVLIREVAALYESFSLGLPSPIKDLHLQYADFAAWQRDWLEREGLRAQLAYWKEQLAGDLPVLDLPTDRPRPPVQSFHGATHRFALPPSLTERLKRTSHKEGVTLFMTLLAGFQVLLHRYTNRRDIIVGTDVANRNRVEIEDLIGFFVNQLVLRTDLGGRPTFRQLLGRVREVTLGAYAHQDLPFEKLVQAMQPERDRSRSPLFQHKIILQNAPFTELKLRELELRPYEIEVGASKFDMTVALMETEQGLSGQVEYSTDLFDHGTIARLMGHFERVLAGAVSDPARPISELPLLTDEELEQTLIGWNRTQADFPRGACIHELFEARAELAPSAVAVIFEDQSLTYAELNRRANQLANYLKRMGVGPEVRVGICVERSLEMIVGLLGILKAGGAYVPLDPAYPLERLALMIEDSSAPVLLTQERVLDALPAHWAQVVCLDSDWELIAQQGAQNPGADVTAENLAYVIYTSGSLGRPKGVLVQHSGVGNLARAMSEAFNTGPGSRVLQFSSLSFDASVSEIFVALLSGATLCVETRDRLLTGPGLTRLMRERGITCVTLPPAVLAAMSEEEIPELRTIVSAGEACSADIVERWAAGRRFMNAYGPTEVTVCASMVECFDGSKKPTLGHPMANTRIYLLDQNLQPTPVGVAGELHIWSVGIARGYLNKPEETAEKFIPDPFSDEPGSRLYKTGDLARYLPDGSIDFLGRCDHQVKVRGFRIEPSEIEEALGRHPAVQQSLVMAREDAKGDRRLVAYVVPNRHDASATQRPFAPAPAEASPVTAGR